MNPNQFDNYIHNHIIVDAYDAIEQQMGWYYYLEGTIDFPFRAYVPSDLVDASPSATNAPT